MKQSSKNNQPDKLTIEEVETFITHNAHTFGATKAVQLAKQLAEAMAMVQYLWHEKQQEVFEGMDSI